MTLEDVAGFGLIACGAASVLCLMWLMLRAVFGDRNVRVFVGYCLLLVALACGLLLAWTVVTGLFYLILTNPSLEDWLVVGGVIGIGVISLAAGLALLRGRGSGGA